MRYIQPKPLDSKIEVAVNGDRVSINLNASKSRKPLIFMLIFLTVWLCFWFVGFLSVGWSIVKGTASWFLIIWFLFWSLGGIFAVKTLFTIIFSSKPEMLILDSTLLGFRDGAKYSSTRDSEGTNYNFVKSKPMRQFPKSQIGNIIIEKRDENNIVSVYYGTEKIEIGEGLKDNELVWLQGVLQNWKGN